MSFRKRNFQRGRIKQLHQQQLNALVSGRTEVEIKRAQQFCENYEETYQEVIRDFEKFIRSKLNSDFLMESRRFHILRAMKEYQDEKEAAGRKMRALNISFDKRPFFGKIFETAQEENLRNIFFSAGARVKELGGILSQAPGKYDSWIFFGIEDYFQEKFSIEMAEQVRKLDDIGVEVALAGQTIKFGLNEQELAGVVSGSFACDNLRLAINYREKYLFLRDKIAVRDFFDEKLSRLNKRREERNLRALASERTDKQRALASVNRTLKEYNNQRLIVNCCPYCGGHLGEFSGPSAAHFEHIHPVSKGGLSTLENTVFICVECNSKKSNMTLNAFISHSSLDREAIFERLANLGKDF